MLAIPNNEPREDGKHALQTSWSIWYSGKVKNPNHNSKTYESSLQKLATCDTVEDFLLYVHNIFHFLSKLTFSFPIELIQKLNDHRNWPHTITFIFFEIQLR